MNNMRKLMEQVEKLYLKEAMDPDVCRDCFSTPCECDDEEEDEWAERFDMKYAEKEKFKGKTIIVTDLYDGDVYGLFNKKRFMISSPLDRGFGGGVGHVSDSEIEVADLDYSLSKKEEAFLRAWHSSIVNEEEGVDEAFGDDGYAGERSARQATISVHELMDEGMLDPRSVADAALRYMSEDDVKDMARQYEWFGEDDEDNDSYESVQ